MAKTILEYWTVYITTAPLLIKEWLKKEDVYLNKNIKKNSRIADIGCGLGRHIKQLVGRSNEIIGIDCDKKLGAEIKKLSTLKKVKIILKDIKKIELPQNSFDYVLCMGNTFGDFSKNRKSILNIMKKICKSNGKIIISVYSENALLVRIKQYEKIGIKISKIKEGTVYTKDGLRLEQFTKKKLKNIFKLAGLKSRIIKLNKISYLCVANR